MLTQELRCAVVAESFGYPCTSCRPPTSAYHSPRLCKARCEHRGPNLHLIQVAAEVELLRTALQRARAAAEEEARAEAAERVCLDSARELLRNHRTNVSLKWSMRRMKERSAAEASPSPNTDPSPNRILTLALTGY